MFLLMALTPSSVMIFAKLPGASFLSVLMAGQLLGDLVSLTIFGEDAPDLLKVSPRPAKELTRLKLLAACLIGGPIIFIVPLLMFFISTNAALITLAFTLLSACLAGLIELKITKPTTKRKSTLRREISVLSTVLTLAMIALVGGVCSLLVYGVS